MTLYCLQSHRGDDSMAKWIKAKVELQDIYYGLRDDADAPDNFLHDLIDALPNDKARELAKLWAPEDGEDEF